VAENELSMAGEEGAAAAESPMPAPSPHDLGAAIAAAAPAGAVESVAVERGGAELVIGVQREALPAVMALLRDDPRFAYEQCMDITALDWPERSPRFDVVYNLLSLSLNRRLRVVVATDEGAPVPSLMGLYPSATWYERETWDMFGIVFEGQTDLRRLLTDYGFEGHPLRKDFPLTGYVEVRYDEERKQVVYGPVKLTQDFRNFDFLSPWEAMTTLPGDEKVHTNREHQEAQARQRLEGPRA
jgi:NADH-quinone oxidoreductase subunit C